MKFFVALAGIVSIAAGCATQDELRRTEAQQGQAVQALRAGANRSESVVSDLRTEIRRTQDSMHELDVALADANARADATREYADEALSTSRKFVANLVVTREEQRRQLEENGAAFADLRRKLADLDTRLQAQQRVLEQSVLALTDGTRRLYAVETELQEAGRRSALLATKAKTAQDTDESLTRQLATVRKQVEDARLVLSSEGLMQLMRELEGVRRNSASLRGTIEELQKAQADSAAQTKNFYLDLDSRVRQLKQSAPQPAAAESAIAPAAATDHPVSQ